MKYDLYMNLHLMWKVHDLCYIFKHAWLSPMDTGLISRHLPSRKGSHFLASGQGGWAANLPLHLCFPNRSFCQWETIRVANAPETMAPRITRKCRPLHYWKIVICWGGIITCVSYVLIFYHTIKVEIRFKVSTQIMSTFSRCLEKQIYCVIILSFYAIKGKYLRSSQYVERCLLTTPVH